MVCQVRFLVIIFRYMPIIGMPYACGEANSVITEQNWLILCPSANKVALQSPHILQDLLTLSTNTKKISML